MLDDILKVDYPNFSHWQNPQHKNASTVMTAVPVRSLSWPNCNIQEMKGELLKFITCLFNHVIVN